MTDYQVTFFLLIMAILATTAFAMIYLEYTKKV